MARNYESIDGNEEQAIVPDAPRRRSTPVWLFMWLSATILVGYFWGGIVAAEMVFTLPVILWARRLLRGIRQGRITRRLRWWANSGYSLTVTNASLVERSKSPLAFWAYIIREGAFFAIISFSLLMPIIAMFLDDSPGP